MYLHKRNAETRAGRGKYMRYRRPVRVKETSSTETFKDIYEKVEKLKSTETIQKTTDAMKGKQLEDFVKRWMKKKAAFPVTCLEENEKSEPINGVNDKSMINIQVDKNKIKAYIYTVIRDAWKIVNGNINSVQKHAHRESKKPKRNTLLRKRSVSFSKDCAQAPCG